jgi:hypothetical protein
MRLRSTFGALLFAVALLGAQTNQAAAQFSPGVFADANHPSGPPDPEKEDQIWQVDPLTGALSVTIPFTTTPAGGRGPKIPFALKYNSSSIDGFIPQEKVWVVIDRALRDAGVEPPPGPVPSQAVSGK